MREHSELLGIEMIIKEDTSKIGKDLIFFVIFSMCDKISRHNLNLIPIGIIHVDIVQSDSTDVI